MIASLTGLSSGPTPGPFLPRSALSFAATAYPDREAVRCGERSVTYDELDVRVRRLGSALQGMGAGVGAVVATLALNSIETVELHYAAALAGVVMNPINWRLDAGTIAHILEHGGADVLLVDPSFAELASAACGRMGRAPRLVMLGADYDALLSDGDPHWPGPALADDAAPLALNYTSGTTGDPKGVALHHRGALVQAYGNVMAIDWARNARLLWIMPIFHSLAYCLPWTMPLVAGAQVCLPRFEPAAALRLMIDAEVTHFAAAPTIMDVLLRALDGRSMPISPTVILAGSAPSPDLIARSRAAGFAVVHAYGSTETFGAVTINLDPAPERAHWQGTPYPTVGELMLVRPGTLEPVPDGTPGEVVVRGPTVMTGYLHDPEATAGAIEDGWMRMGDVAVRHPGGAIEVVDRVKDIIISGGENISSLEVEALLLQHPDVAEAAVVAMPDAKWGESPCAFVKLKAEARADEDELIAWVRERAARFKTPKRIVFDDLPRTATGKVRKGELRARVRVDDRIAEPN